METLWQDLRIGFRQLLADKGFSIAAILTLALGIGATATILTVVNSVLLKELPYSDHARVMVLQGSLKDKGEAGAACCACRSYASSGGSCSSRRARCSRCARGSGDSACPRCAGGSGGCRTC